MYLRLNSLELEEIVVDRWQGHQREGRRQKISWGLSKGLGLHERRG